MGCGASATIMADMSNAAINRVLLVHDPPGRVTGREAKVRRYRLARLSLSTVARADRQRADKRTRG